MAELTITVTQLNTYIKNIFDAEEMLIGIKVVGEITNLKASGKATYFDLKDDNACLSCVVFNPTIMEGINFGEKVTVKGQLNYYIKGGRLSFVVSKIENFGQGDLYKQYLELKAQLEKEGKFDEAHKKPLPEYVRRVGVVTSRTGAVIRDIIRVKRQKNNCSDVVLFPAKVQGIGAKEEIINGIKFLDEYGVDVIIVARGGGSFEDYQPFNTREVVETVYDAKTPVISAIGHENDWSLIDFVADKRASTPSVASEMVFFSERDYLRRLSLPLENFIVNTKNTLNAKRLNLTRLSQILESETTRKITDERHKLELAQNNLIIKIDHCKDLNLAKLDLTMANFSKNNPKEFLSRGYAKVLVSDKILTSVKDVSQGERVEISVIDGKIIATATAIEENKK